MKKTRYLKFAFCIAVFLILTVSLIIMFRMAEKFIDLKNKPSEDLNYTDSGNSGILYNGEWYVMDDDVETMLILGIDSLQTDGVKSSSSQADFFALVVMNKAENSVKILHINRDTMTDIYQINKNGERYGTFKAQLALAHTYGSEGRMQCRNTVLSVENLLYGIDIDHYLSLTMDAVAVLNDSIGGVPITVEEDLSAIGKDFVKGTEKLLLGDEALAFVRYRDNDGENSNLKRMARQRQYVEAFWKKYNQTPPENTLDMLIKVNEYFVSDYTVHQMSLLLERLQSYSFDGIISLEGKAVMGEEFVEYYIDEDAAMATVVELFYKPDNEGQ